MKKIYNKIKVATLVVMATLMMASCSEWLELYPEGETLLEDYWKSADDIESVLASCYLSVMDEKYLQRAIVWGELRSDNMEKANKTPSDLIDILDVNIQATNSFCDWAVFYETINLCNTVIHYAPQVMEEDKNLSTSNMEAYRAEARAIRAMSYFYLVRTFGDVPMVMKPTIDDTDGFAIAKSSADSVLNVVVDDLREALMYAQSSFGSYRQDYNKSRFTKQSIRALLADILLWQGRYQECVDVCDEFLAYNNKQMLTARSGYYELGDASLLLPMFTHHAAYTNEVIFATAFQPSGMDASFVGLYGHQAKDPQISASEKLYNRGMFNSTDKRRYLTYISSANDGDYTYYQIPKFVASSYSIVGSAAGSAATYSNVADKQYEWIFYRLPDIYLMRAEALVELAATKSTNDEINSYLNSAIDMVNNTYMRANVDLRATDSLSIKEYFSVDLMRELVMDERQREFMFEGKRWFDLLRQARRFNTADYAVSAVEDKRFPNSSSQVALSKMSTMDALYMPIYQTEIENNDKLVQNPFYQMDETTEKNENK
ncbi:MAG: RagB/SusD family nutrient uptake outer membrane protein [Bacteroidales bacterium]|nr:RagB/SusD family nutrient uptake outer membrane protein [Bacteroidales bacterium]